MKLMLDSENDLKAVLENTETSIIEENIQDIFVYQTPIDLKDIETEEKLSKNINRKLISMYSKTKMKEHKKLQKKEKINPMTEKHVYKRGKI